MTDRDPLLVLVDVAADLLAEASDNRNRAVIEAVAAGHSHREVAAAAGITHPTIAKIVRAETVGTYGAYAMSVEEFDASKSIDGAWRPSHDGQTRAWIWTP